MFLRNTIIPTLSLLPLLIWITANLVLYPTIRFRWMAILLCFFLPFLWHLLIIACSSNIEVTLQLCPCCQQRQYQQCLPAGFSSISQRLRGLLLWNFTQACIMTFSLLHQCHFQVKRWRLDLHLFLLNIANSQIYIYPLYLALFLIDWKTFCKETSYRFILHVWHFQCNTSAVCWPWPIFHAAEHSQIYVSTAFSSISQTLKYLLW